MTNGMSRTGDLSSLDADTNLVRMLVISRLKNLHVIYICEELMKWSRVARCGT